MEKIPILFMVDMKLCVYGFRRELCSCVQGCKVLGWVYDTPSAEFHASRSLEPYVYSHGNGDRTHRTHDDAVCHDKLPTEGRAVTHCLRQCVTTNCRRQFEKFDKFLVILCRLFCRGSRHDVSARERPHRSRITRDPKIAPFLPTRRDGNGTQDSAVEPVQTVHRRSTRIHRKKTHRIIGTGSGKCMMTQT